MVGIAAMTTITNAAITLSIDPVGGEQDGVEFDTTTGAGTISQADMQAALTAADLSRAGVFDMTGMVGSAGNTWTETGAITINGSGSLLENAVRAEVLSTSGVNHAWLQASRTLTFDVSSVAGGLGVTHFGLVHIGWSSGGTFIDGLDITANFSGGGSASLNSDAAEAAQGVGGANGDWDTWFGFEAPTTETITSVVITKQGLNSNWAAVDDVTYIVAVPEPSSSALLGLGGLALILRRRK